MKNLKPASFLILVILLFSACKKDPVDYSAYNAEHGTHIGDGPIGTGGTTDQTAVYYFKGTLGGKALSWIVNADESSGWVSGSALAGSRDMGVNIMGLTALLSASENFKPQLGVEFRTVKYNFDEDKSAVFNSFITTGAWPFATSDDYVVDKKVLIIHYTDATGKVYSSIGAQTAASPNVSTITKVPPELGRNESLKVKLTFSCTLYPADGTGSPVTLTGAEALVRQENLLN
ncbi:MAG: hypothetical protein ABJA76_19460 [Mucilaginibacter sp.]